MKRYLFECTSILPDACIYLSMFTLFCSQFAIDMLINIYYINLKLILANIWKMIDQIIFPWKLHSDEWKSTRYIIKKYWRQLWRRVSTITSFDHCVGNVMTRLFYFIITQINFLNFDWLKHCVSVKKSNFAVSYIRYKDSWHVTWPYVNGYLNIINLRLAIQFIYTNNCLYRTI
jgi:hypothetical protein